MISRLDFGSRCISPRAMGVSALARRAAPASRARMPGSLRSRRWPPAPPWRRPPTTSAALLVRTLSSLGQPEVAGHSNGRAGQAASRLFPQRSEHVRPRVYTAHTRAAAHVHPRRPNRALSISAPPELSATGPRGADGQVRRMGRARRPQPSHGHWAANRPGRARPPTRGAPLTIGIALAQRRRRRNDEAEPLWLREDSED